MPGCRFCLRLATTLYALLSLAVFAAAQDMTVYTTVSPVGDEAAPRVIGRSLTLFHTGKVYDYMEDVGELVVFEPVHDRFIILNSNFVATRVEFGELQQFLKVAQVEAENYLREASQSRDRRMQQLVPLLEFQLRPTFAEQFEPALNRLTLTSDTLSYAVQAARPASAAAVEQYLAYADWAARLNYVLHPQATYPEPRLRLNASLRAHGLIPTVVQLETRTDRKHTLRAEHKFQWEFQASDRSHIHKWERLLESDQIRWVSLHEYQDQLAAEAKQRAARD